MNFDLSWLISISLFFLLSFNLLVLLSQSYQCQIDWLDLPRCWVLRRVYITFPITFLPLTNEMMFTPAIRRELAEWIVDVCLLHLFLQGRVVIIPQGGAIGIGEDERYVTFEVDTPAEENHTALRFDREERVASDILWDHQVIYEVFASKDRCMCFWF